MVTECTDHAERAVQARGRETSHGARFGTLGRHLLQALQKPDSGRGRGHRDGGVDAGFGQIARILPGDDLRSFLAGTHATGGDPEVLLDSVVRSYQLMAREQRIQFLAKLRDENATVLAS